MSRLDNRASECAAWLSGVNSQCAAVGSRCLRECAACDRCPRHREFVQPGPEISPRIYGHFIEHLGGVIYDGIWVGRDSKIPNVGGIRKQFVDDMKRDRRAEPALAGRLLRRRLSLARRHRRAAQRPRTYNFWENRMPRGRARGRDQRVRHPRVHASVPARRRRAVCGRERRLRDAAGVSRLGVVLQRARGHAVTRRRARRRTAIRSPSPSSTGASATSRGAAAAT